MNRLSKKNKKNPQDFQLQWLWMAVIKPWWNVPSHFAYKNLICYTCYALHKWMNANIKVHTLQFQIRWIRHLSSLTTFQTTPKRPAFHVQHHSLRSKDWSHVWTFTTRGKENSKVESLSSNLLKNYCSSIPCLIVKIHCHYWDPRYRLSYAFQQTPCLPACSLKPIKFP